MRGIRPPALFELRARSRTGLMEWWRSGVMGNSATCQVPLASQLSAISYQLDNGGMPWACATLPFRGAHCLANRPGSLDRLTFQSGPRGRTRTCNLSVLSGTPLRWATRGGAHGRICTDTLRVLSALSLHWTTWANWCRVREFHPQPLRSERSASGSWANAA